jgi:hypothetical protein
MKKKRASRVAPLALVKHVKFDFEAFLSFDGVEGRNHFDEKPTIGPSGTER